MSFEPGGRYEMGAWSSRGEFLGVVHGPLRSTPEDTVYSASSDSSDSSSELPEDYLYVGRGDSGGGVSIFLHRFTRSGKEGYRVQVREWDGEEESAYWIAPITEDEGYIGMFTENEARRAFPYLFAAREMPGGFRVI